MSVSLTDRKGLALEHVATSDEKVIRRATIAELQVELATTRVRRRRRELLLAVLAPLTAAVLALLVWQLIADALNIASYLLPTPASVWREITDQPHLFVTNGLTTLGEIGSGYPVAILVGVLLGVALAMSKLMSRMLYPLIVWAQSTPKIAIAPLLLIWFGFGLLPKVELVAIEAFFPVVVNTAAGFLSIDPEMLELGRILGFSRTAVFFKIRVPNSLPFLFTGFKIAATGAVAGAIVAEYVSASGGLGYLLVEFQSALNTSGLVAAAAIIGTMGVVLFLIVAKIEDLVLPWHVSRRGK